jgi:chromate reductase, NAD(P)H dehydrogenase (quinone)
MDNNPNQKEQVSFLLFSASLQKNSLNTQLAQLTKEILEKNGGKVKFRSMADFDTPSFNQDLEVSDTPPPGAIALRDSILDNDAFIIASPEYNGAMPGLLKNVIDWVSRFRPQPFNEKQALLMSASPSMVGGNRGLWSLRVPLEHLGARVYPNMFSLATAHKAFTPDGKLADATMSKRFEENIVGFMALAEAQKHYPCIKRAWVEFLGEKTDAATERVE